MGYSRYQYIGPYIVVSDNEEVELVVDVAIDELAETLTLISIGKDLCWIPNYYEEEPPYQVHFDSYDDPTHLPIGDQLVYDVICWFTNTFKEEIEIICKHYPTASIRWGFVTYDM